jgi:hypothetical protein
VSLPTLTAVSENFYVTINASLETTLAQAVRDQLLSFTGTTTICGNKNGSACP